MDKQKACSKIAFQGLSMNFSCNSGLVFQQVRRDLKWPISVFSLAIWAKCWLFCQDFWAGSSDCNICGLWWTVVKGVSVMNEMSCLFEKRVESQTGFSLEKTEQMNNNWELILMWKINTESSNMQKITPNNFIIEQRAALNWDEEKLLSPNVVKNVLHKEKI